MPAEIQPTRLLRKREPKGGSLSDEVAECTRHLMTE